MQTLEQQDVHDSIKAVINLIAWKLLDANADEEIYRFSKWGIFSFTLKVRDLQPLFSVLFGARPVAS